MWQVERAQVPSFENILLAVPQNHGAFPRRNVRMRDIEF